jgi:hypothetical protein
MARVAPSPAVEHPELSMAVVALRDLQRVSHRTSATTACTSWRWPQCDG